MATSNNTDRRPNRSQAEWDALALDVIVPRLQAGDKMTDIRAEFGAGPTIRRALSRVGYNTKGQQVTVVGAVKTARVAPKVLAQRVADRRMAGAAWWRLELETGKSADDLRTLLTEHGHDADGMTAGRMVISERGKRKAEKAAAEAEAARKAEAAAKRKSRKAAKAA